MFSPRAPLFFLPVGNPRPGYGEEVGGNGFLSPKCRPSRHLRRFGPGTTRAARARRLSRGREEVVSELSTPRAPGGSLVRVIFIRAVEGAALPRRRSQLA